MLYLVTMEVKLPPDLDPTHEKKLKEDERDRAQQLQRDGKWRHLWRVVGRYANVSVFDVASNDELHDLLLSLPLFPYLAIDVIPLARHPSDINGK